MEVVDEVGKVTVVRTNGVFKVLNLRYQGRLSRSQFFCTTLAIFLFMMGLHWGLSLVFSTEYDNLDNHGFWILILFGCTGFFFFMRACVLRLHDMGSAGGWVFLFFLFAGIFYLSMCLLSPSKGANEYGEPPVNSLLEKWVTLGVLGVFIGGVLLSIAQANLR